VPRELDHVLQDAFSNLMAGPSSQELDESAKDCLVVEVDYELRVDHDLQALCGLLDLLLRHLIA